MSPYDDAKYFGLSAIKCIKLITKGKVVKYDLISKDRDLFNKGGNLLMDFETKNALLLEKLDYLILIFQEDDLEQHDKVENRKNKQVQITQKKGKAHLSLPLLARACGVPAVGVRAVDCWQ